MHAHDHVSSHCATRRYFLILASLSILFHSLSLTFGRHCSYHIYIRSPVGCKANTCSAPKNFWVALVWRLAWTARALDRLLIRCSVPNMEDIIIGSAHQRCRVCVVRCSVAVELVDFDRDSRTDGFIYKASIFIHFRPSFLEFLRRSKTSL